jgi:hypothetical protein
MPIGVGVNKLLTFKKGECMIKIMKQQNMTVMSILFLAGLFLGYVLGHYHGTQNVESVLKAEEKIAQDKNAAFFDMSPPKKHDAS